MDMMDFTAAGLAELAKEWDATLAEAQRVLGLGTTMAFMIQHVAVNSYMEGLRRGDIGALTVQGWSRVQETIGVLEVMIKRAG